MNLNDLLSNDRRSFNREEVPLHFFYTKKASCLRFQIYGKQCTVHLHIYTELFGSLSKSVLSHESQPEVMHFIHFDLHA